MSQAYDDRIKKEQRDKRLGALRTFLNVTKLDLTAALAQFPAIEAFWETDVDVTENGIHRLCAELRRIATYLEDKTGVR